VPGLEKVNCALLPLVLVNERSKVSLPVFADAPGHAALVQRVMV
jgi:hypothetical protein